MGQVPALAVSEASQAATLALESVGWPACALPAAMARRRGRAFVRLVVILLTLSSSSAEESGMSSMAGLSAPRSTRRMSTFVCAYFELRRLRSDNGLQGRDLSIRFRLLFRTKSSTKFQKRTTKDLQRFVVEEARQMPEEPRINAIVHWQFKLLDRGPDHDPRPRPRPHPDPATARPTRVEARAHDPPARGSSC